MGQALETSARLYHASHSTKKLVYCTNSSVTNDCTPHMQSVRKLGQQLLFAKTVLIVKKPFCAKNRLKKKKNIKNR